MGVCPDKSRREYPSIIGSGNKLGVTVANTVSMILARLVCVWTVFVYIDGKIDRLDDRIDAIAVSQAKVEGLLPGYFSLEKDVAYSDTTASSGNLANSKARVDPRSVASGIGVTGWT